MATLGGLANQQKTVQAIQQAQAVAAQIQAIQAAQQRAEQLAQKVVAQQKQVQSVVEDQNDQKQLGWLPKDVVLDKDARQRAMVAGVLPKWVRPKQETKTLPQPASPPVPGNSASKAAPLSKVANVADASLGVSPNKLGGPKLPNPAGAVTGRVPKFKGPVLTRRQGGGHFMLPPVGTFKNNELIVINLGSASLAGDLKVKETDVLSALGFSVSRVEVPEGSAINERKALAELAPDREVAFNRMYAPYRMGLGLGVPAKGADKGCSLDRCFGANLIKWQPRFATCARAVKIGIIDTGFDKTHSALRHLEGKAEYEEFLPSNAKRVPQHGTAVLSVLAGDPESGTPGLVPTADYYIANAFYADAGGHAMSDTIYILKALNWMMLNKVDVVNMSFSGPDDEVMHEAVKRLTRAGIVVIAAAGNDGPSAPPSYPAGFNEVIAVTAVDKNRAPYRLANRGPYVDLAAPGVGIWTALPGEREGAQTGTSFAVPYVTAVVAANLPTELGETDDETRTKRLALSPLLKNVLGVSARGMGAGVVQAFEGCGGPSDGGVAGAWTSTVHSAGADR